MSNEMDAQVVLFDPENALDEEWLLIDVDTDPRKLLRIQCKSIDDVAKTINDSKEYKVNYGDLEYEEMSKMMFVIDSLGMLIPTDVDPIPKRRFKR